MSTPQQDFVVPGRQDRVLAFGFKLAEGGAHISRTIMLNEITRLMASSDAVATSENYNRLVVTENVLGKSTETTRQKTFRHLRELYALSSKIPIFSVYRELMKFDPQSGPLLSLLIAWARDPLLRATTPAILGATSGEQVTGSDLQHGFF